MAFHPAYHLPAVPGFGLFWVNYTNTNGDTVIARYTVARANPQQADPASALTLFVIMQPFSNHNGGLKHFRPSGRASRSTLSLHRYGRWWWRQDPRNNAQRDDTLLGKMLRLDPSLEARPALPFYTIPPDNPMAAAGVPLGTMGKRTAQSLALRSIGRRRPLYWRCRPEHLGRSELHPCRDAWWAKLRLASHGGAVLFRSTEQL